MFLIHCGESCTTGVFSRLFCLQKVLLVQFMHFFRDWFPVEIQGDEKVWGMLSVLLNWVCLFRPWFYMRSGRNVETTVGIYTHWRTDCVRLEEREREKEKERYSLTGSTACFRLNGGYTTHTHTYHQSGKKSSECGDGKVNELLPSPSQRLFCRLFNFRAVLSSCSSKYFLPSGKKKKKNLHDSLDYCLRFCLYVCSSERLPGNSIWLLVNNNGNNSKLYYPPQHHPPYIYYHSKVLSG